MIAHPTLYPRWVLLLYDDSNDKADDEYTSGDNADENNEQMVRLSEQGRLCIKAMCSKKSKRVTQKSISLKKDSIKLLS